MTLVPLPIISNIYVFFFLFFRNWLNRRIRSLNCLSLIYRRHYVTGNCPRKWCCEPINLRYRLGFKSFLFPLLAVIAQFAVQLSIRTIFAVLCFHRHLNNAGYNKSHSLIGKPYLAIIACREMFW